MNNLQRFREEKKLTQSQLAIKLELSPRYIAFLEVGDRTPSLKTANKIANFFNTTIEEVFLINKCTDCTHTRNKKEAN